MRDYEGGYIDRERREPYLERRMESSQDNYDRKRKEPYYEDRRYERGYEKRYRDVEFDRRSDDIERRKGDDRKYFEGDGRQRVEYDRRRIEDYERRKDYGYEIREQERRKYYDHDRERRRHSYDRFPDERERRREDLQRKKEDDFRREAEKRPKDSKYEDSVMRELVDERGSRSYERNSRSSRGYFDNTKGGKEKIAVPHYNTNQNYGIPAFDIAAANLLSAYQGYGIVPTIPPAQMYVMSDRIKSVPAYPVGSISKMAHNANHQIREKSLEKKPFGSASSRRKKSNEKSHDGEELNSDELQFINENGLDEERTEKTQQMNRSGLGSVPGGFRSWMDFFIDCKIKPEEAKQYEEKMLKDDILLEDWVNLEMWILQGFKDGHKLRIMKKIEEYKAK